MKKLFEKYGFKTLKNELDLKNPIVDNMDTLRPNAVLGMLEAVQRNMNFGKKRIPLFEIGKVFDENRKYVTLDKISQNMQNAIVATEDKNFWTNPGIDVK